MRLTTWATQGTSFKRAQALILTTPVGQLFVWGVNGFFAGTALLDTSRQTAFEKRRA